MGLALTYGVGQYSAGHASESHSAGWDRAYKASTGGRGVIWAHSAGSTSSQEPWIAANNTLPLLGALVSLGLPVVSGDFGGNGPWGNDTAQGLIGDAGTWTKAQYGAKPDKVILAGVSMGGLNVLNWARNNPTLVRAVILFYPCVNLQAQHDGTGGATANAASIETAYGGLAAFNAAEPTHNPSHPGIPASYTGVPIYMGYSDADTVVGSANQTAFISAVGGSALTSRVYAGAAHADMTKINVGDVLSWIGSYT